MTLSFMSHELQCKVVLIGASGTGKTSLIYRLMHNSFESQLRTTLGAGLSVYHTRFADRKVKLNIWDTAGQENYRSLARIYFRDAQCVLIVYDMADHTTYDDIRYWKEELDQLEPGSHFDFLIAGKSDRRGKRAVSEDEGRQLAADLGARYFEASALSGEGVTALFDSIAERFVKFVEERGKAELGGLPEMAIRQSCC
jgi:small GTP-binding protein